MSTRLLIGKRSSSSLSFLLLLLVAFVLPSIQGTEIKWTAGSTKNDPAATAPRSQKYWDEHGIKRPDYAKTDAELAAERRQNGNGGADESTTRGSSSSLAMAVFKWMILIVAAGMGIIGYQQQHRIGGDGVRLDESISSLLFKRHQLTPEEARNARLARFDDSMQAE